MIISSITDYRGNENKDVKRIISSNITDNSVLAISIQIIAIVQPQFQLYNLQSACLGQVIRVSAEVLLYKPNICEEDGLSQVHIPVSVNISTNSKLITKIIVYTRNLPILSYFLSLSGISGNAFTEILLHFFCDNFSL